MTLVLQTIGVRKKFAGVVALEDFEIAIEQGEIHGLVGANGAGKTTILNVIGGQLMADGGIVRIAGRDVERLSSWRRAELGLGRTFQEGRLWPELTIAEHFGIAIDASSRTGPRALRKDPIKAMCAMVELPATALKRTPVQMILLERRRVELAMAALNASDLLLIDEIGAGLDIEASRSLYRLVSQLIGRSETRAAVVVEHKLRLLAEFATRISFLENGKVGQRADCKEPAQLQHLIDRMFDPRGGAAAAPLKGRTLQ
jgi:ABC-type branched-subunit amino acid transport system ATPase component